MSNYRWWQAIPLFLMLFPGQTTTIYHGFACSKCCAIRKSTPITRIYMHVSVYDETMLTTPKGFYFRTFSTKAWSHWIQMAKKRLWCTEYPSWIYGYYLLRKSSSLPVNNEYLLLIHTRILMSILLIPISKTGSAGWWLLPTNMMLHFQHWHRSVDLRTHWYWLIQSIWLNSSHSAPSGDIDSLMVPISITTPSI